MELFIDPGAPPDLPPHLPRRELQPGRWLVLLEWEEATMVLDALDMEHVEDFRLYSATLEDLYVHYASSTHQADALSLIVTMGMAGLGPVVIPPDRLPPLLIALGRLSPATYAASALRQAMIGPLTGQIALDLAALIGWTILAFGAVGRILDWRQR